MTTLLKSGNSANLPSIIQQVGIFPVTFTRYIFSSLYKFTSYVVQLRYEGKYSKMMYTRVRYDKRIPYTVIKN